VAGKPPADPAGQTFNLLLAVIGCTVIAALCAVTVYFTADFILQSYQDSNAQALLITGDKIIADDKNLEAKLNSAQLALQTCKEISLALALSCVVIAGSVLYRGLKARAAGGLAS
jgi:histidinol dehydrogenase